MKSFTKFFGVIVIAAVITFSFTACDNGNVDDKKEKINTTGRLTVTGLNDFISHEIWGYGDVKLYVCNEGYSGDYSDTHTSLKVTGDSATLKVYRKGGGDVFRLYDYNGNDQNIKFSLFSEKNWIDGVNTSFGSVTVNFTNGVGSGVFVPEP